MPELSGSWAADAAFGAEFHATRNAATALLHDGIGRHSCVAVVAVGMSRRNQGCTALAVAVAACSITLKTSAGCEMYITWLDLTSVVCAFMRLA